MNQIRISEWPPVYSPSQENSEDKYVFISYCHEDAQLIYQDLHTLAENGARFWYDKAMNSGEDWTELADRRIKDKNCSAALFYITKKALKSAAVLRELEYAMERSRNDPNFTYVSVNIPEKTVFQLLKETDVAESTFLRFLTAFHEKKLYIPRGADPFCQDHILNLINMFKKAEAIDERLCQLSQLQLFECRDYSHGVEIVKYTGVDTVVSVPSTINGRKVISIGISAFKNNKHVHKLRIPEGIERIDDFAFSGCCHLESIILPDSLQTLGYEVFRDCSMLYSLFVPRNVQFIGDYCFYRCHKLKELHLQSAVPLTLAFAAFSECQSIEKLTLPETTVSIGPYVFNNCISLKSITIPRSVRSIGLSAFYSCASLEIVRFMSETVLENNRMFSRCRNLKSILFRASTMDAYKNAFDWENHRAQMHYELDIPQNISCTGNMIQWSASPGTERYIIRLNGKVHVVQQCHFHIPKEELCSSYRLSVQACSEAPDMIHSLPSEEYLIRISQAVYEIAHRGTDVVLVKYNGTGDTATIPNEVTIIGERAFFNHNELEKVLFSQNVHTIEARAFYHCTNLHCMQFPISLRSIGKEAFWGIAVKDLKILQGIQFLGEGCFACCNSLEQLQILSPTVVAEAKVFYRCIKLRTVSFPNGLRELFNSMFRGCTELERIVLPADLHTIRNGAISYIMRLTKIQIPASVNLIESGAFSNSFGLAAISVAPKNKTYFDQEGVLLCKTDGTAILQFPADKPCAEYTVREDVSVIGEYAFMDAEHLRKVTISGKMESIRKSAFERCPNLEEILVMDNLGAIEENAFKDCIKLHSLYLMCTAIPELLGNAFDNVSDNLKIFVPQKYLNNYYRAIEWQPIRHLITPIATVKND